jgi:hypothetical protein
MHLRSNKEVVAGVKASSRQIACWKSSRSACLAEMALHLPSFLVLQDQQKKLTHAAIQLENLEEKMTLLCREARRTELTKVPALC